MRIRDLSPAQRIEIGRKLYQARHSGITWEHAGELHLRQYARPDERTHGTAHGFARMYALQAGEHWPPHLRSGPKPETPAWIRERFAAVIEAESAAMRWRTARHLDDVLSFLRLSHVRLASLSGVPVGIVSRYISGVRIKERNIRRIWQVIDETIDRMHVRRDWLILTDGPARFTNEMRLAA